MRASLPIQSYPGRLHFFYAIFSSVLLNSNVLLLFFMIPLFYSYYRYGRDFFFRVLLLTFILSFVIDLLIEFFFLATGIAERKFILQSFVAEIIFVAALLFSLFIYAKTQKTKWPYRLIIFSFIARIGMIPTMLILENILQNSGDFLTGLGIGSAMPDQTQALQTLVINSFTFFRNDLAWVAVLLWVILSWYIAIIILHRKNRFDTQIYFNFFFQRIQGNFFHPGVLILGVAIFVLRYFLLGTPSSPSVFAVIVSNLFFVILFLYVLRGLIVVYVLFASRLIQRKEIYFLVTCIILVVPVVGVVLLVLLLCAGVLQNVLHIETRFGSSRKGDIS